MTINPDEDAPDTQVEADACADFDSADTRARPSVSMGHRFTAGALALSALALLLVAAGLSPDPSGIGTHRQMGLRACAWHAERGFVCPTCGMTTSFALAADGRLLSAATTQPAGALLALLTAMTAWVAGYIAVTGAPIARWLRRLCPPLYAALGLAAIVAAGWAYGVLGR